LISFLVFFIILSIISLGYYILNKEEIKRLLNEQDIVKNENVSTVIQNEDKKDEVKNVTIGTGIERPNNYFPSDNYYYIDNDIYKLDDVINSLKNETLKEKINEFITTSENNLEEKKSEFEKYINNGNKNKEQVGSLYKDDYYKFINRAEEYLDGPEENVEWRCVNGYLSIMISYRYQYGDFVNMASDTYKIIHNYGPYMSYCAVFDIYTGEKLSFGDMFFKGEDYSTDLYEFLQLKIGEQRLGEYQKRELKIIPNDYEYFTLDRIIFNKTNLYFSEAVTMYTNYVYSVFPVLSISRDMSDVLSNIEISKTNSYGQPNITVRQLHINGETYITSKISYWDKKIEEKINNNIEKCTKLLIEKGVFKKMDNLAYMKGENFDYYYNSESKEFWTYIISSNKTGVEAVIDMTTGDLSSVRYFMTQDLQTGGADPLREEFNITADSYNEFQEQLFNALVEHDILIDISDIANEI